MIRVLVVDDQAMVREGFSALLAAQDDVEVVGAAEDGLQAIKMVAERLPDVVLMDVRMPVLDGLRAAEQILLSRGCESKVLMLTTFDLDDYVYEALRVGASGFLLKHAPASELVAAVRVVAAGEALLAPSVTRRLIQDFVRSQPSGRELRARPEALSALTARETDVLKLVARGMSNNEIAAELVLAEQTVKSHVSRILTKLALRDRAQAVIVAYESGLVAATR